MKTEFSLKAEHEIMNGSNYLVIMFEERNLYANHDDALNKR